MWLRSREIPYIEERLTRWREKTSNVFSESGDSSPNEHTNNVLTDRERDEVLYKLFNRYTLDSSFLYKWKWAELYEKISTDKSYPFIEIEKKILSKLRWNPKFWAILKKTECITDVWAWDWWKAVALLWDTWWWWTYVPEDYSFDMLKIAAENVKKWAPWIDLWSLNVLTNGKHLPGKIGNNMYLFLWGTICNMLDHDILSELRNMDNNSLVSWNYILLSFFTAPNTQEEIDDLIKIYNSEANKRFHENWMEMLWLSKDLFEFDTVYEKDDPNQTVWPFPWKIKWVIRAKKDNIVIRSSSWREIAKVNKWDEFTLHFSRRFTQEWIEKLLKESWCKEIFTESENWDSIMLLKKKPWRLQTLKNACKKVLIWALITWWLWWIIHNEAQNQKKEDIWKARTEWKSRQDTETNWDSEKILYYYETNELVNALQLDNIKNKDVIIKIFNKYVSKNKTDWVTTFQLIQWFWKEYWDLLIDNFGVRHYPYDYISQGVIENTKNLWEELSYIANSAGKNQIRSTRHYLDYWKSEAFHRGRPFEYFDWSQKYILVKVKIDVWWCESRVYFASKEINEWHGSYYKDFTTQMVNNITDKSWLDSEIVSNTEKLQDSYEITIPNLVFTGNSLCIQNQDKNKIVRMSALNEVYIKPHAVCIWNWKIYYIINVETESWGKIWLASETLAWEYTTTTFNTISGEFSTARSLL